MEDLNTLTAVIGIANLLTGTVAAALFLLIFWQNPKNLLNQLFGFTMLALTVYSVANIMSRLPSLGVDPLVSTYINGSLYLAFVMGLFLSSIRFADLHSYFIRVMTFTGIVIFFILMFLLWGGYTTDSLREVPDKPGTFESQLTIIGVISVALTFMYPLLTTIILYQVRHRAPRLRDFWKAPAMAVFGIIWLATLWPYTYIPFNAIALAVAAFIMGRAILRENLFNPLADVTRELQEKNRELQDADRVKNQFLAKMSHELRTPLNSIIGYTDLVLEGLYGDLSDQQADRLQKVLRNGRNLLNLINDILDLSHIEIGQIVLYPEPVSTQDLLESVVSVVQPQMESKGLALLREYDSASPIFVDRMRAQQIITNIMSNAVKFTPNGHIRIQAQDENGNVHITIEDTGIGIPEDKMHRVFQEFRQIDNAPTREYGGTGLGMSITRRLVEMSGGKIWVESKLDAGTTFHLLLPNAYATQEALLGSRHDLKVLVIEDTHDTQLYMNDAIAALKPEWALFFARSGREGLAIAAEQQPDVISLDIMMPSMDGWEVLKRLQADDQTRHIPVIIVSHVDNYDLAYKLGASAILTKPVNPSVLVDTLERVASGHHIRSEEQA